MEVEDALDIPHGLFRGRQQKGACQGRNYGQHGDDGENYVSVSFHKYSSLIAKLNFQIKNTFKYNHRHLIYPVYGLFLLNLKSGIWN
jgi:hypothetical protein